MEQIMEYLLGTQDPDPVVHPHPAEPFLESGEVNYPLMLLYLAEKSNCMGIRICAAVELKYLIRRDWHLIPAMLNAIHRGALLQLQGYVDLEQC